MENQKVTLTQFYSVFYLSILVSVFMYMSNSEVRVGTTDAILRPVAFSVFNIIAALPMYFYYKTSGGKTPLQNTRELSKTLSVIFALLYIVVYFISALRTSARFDLFASSEVFPETDMTFFIIAIIVICAALSLVGFSALARSGVIFSIAVIAAVALIISTLFSEIDVLNFTPLFSDGAKKFFTDSFGFSVFSIESGAIILFLPEIKGKVEKGYLGWIAANLVSSVIIVFTVVGTLGGFADSQLFPTYTVSTLGEFGLFQRLDALETALWILCIITKLTFLITIISRCIMHIFPRLNSLIPPAITAAALSGAMLFITKSVERFTFLSSLSQVIFIYVTAVIALPTAALVINMVLKKKGRLEVKS